MSFLAWFWVLYISAGLFLLMDALVITWRIPGYHWGIKVVGFIIAVLIWPIVFIE